MSKEMREAFENMPRRRVERRRGLDRRGKIGLMLSVAGWLLWSVGILLAYYAFPQSASMLDNLFGKTPRRSWDTAFLRYAEAFWAAGAIMCVLSLFQFRKRYRRRSDKKHLGILTALIINALSFTIFGMILLFLDFF